MDLSTLGVKLVKLLMKREYKFHLKVIEPNSSNLSHYVVNIIIEKNHIESEMASGIDKVFSLALVKGICEAGEIISRIDRLANSDVIAGGFFSKTAKERCLIEAYERQAILWHIDKNIPLIYHQSVDSSQGAITLALLATNSPYFHCVAYSNAESQNDFNYCCSVEKNINFDRVLFKLNTANINKIRLNPKDVSEQFRLSIIKPNKCPNKEMVFDFFSFKNKTRFTRVDSPLKLFNFFEIC
ncbi:MAG: hypothetical protein COW01_14810 [Bdellovibrionales bacterium CG12_big_fil_rev_8_21_14_0_65_38_15]|nr:MAG: hypothetical protein COW79_07725 [Bdellovibrionales bacterium CG22_combo_CG10-13_8_21_14_all_38_13]PIQ52954.1 MAG: hypothetical protein COW01_14810 [Bdellovibrionales bacterium CG12_big_fil_rev_8_21_14_0_65_38_15]PIR28682.1 MAG: hypothetical protein COV38_14570 [Bdellovibrionales bacterium CG11_big_fil_rev_8_21_14_0_20_38_13]